MKTPTASIRQLLLFTLFLTLTGCAQLAKQVDTVKPTAKLTGTHLADIDFDQVDLVFDLAVDNKNPIELDLAGLDYELKIENQSLVSGVTAQAIKLKANSTSPIQLPVTLKFDDLKKLPGELWNKDKLAYELQTRFNINLPVIGNYAIPVDKKGELPVPRIPDIKLKDIKVKNLSFTTADLVAQVEVGNPNDFDLGVKDMDYQIDINKTNWGRGKITQASSIPKKSKGIVEIPLKLDLMSMGTAALSLLRNKAPLDYQIKGNATIDTGLELMKDYKLPLDISGTTSVH